MTRKPYRKEELLRGVDLLYAESQTYMPICGAGKGQEEFDPRGLFKIESQGNWPSCGGHAMSSLDEALLWLKTGKLEQLSRMFAWVEAMRVHGRPNPDSGVTIYAAVKVLKELGLPLEELAPYDTGHWYSEFAPEVYEDAKTRLVRSSHVLKTYDDVMDFHVSGVGFVIWGVPWEFGRGWHAVPSLGHSVPKQEIYVMNSWGENWDGDGWIEWDKRKIERYLAVDGVACFGLSDMAAPEVRPYPFAERFFA